MLRLLVFFVLNFVLPSPLAASRNVTTIARQAHYTKHPHYATQPQNITQVHHTIFSLFFFLIVAFSLCDLVPR